MNKYLTLNFHDHAFEDFQSPDKFFSLKGARDTRIYFKESYLDVSFTCVKLHDPVKKVPSYAKLGQREAYHDRIYT